MSQMIQCACGCGSEITLLGLNGKPRKFLRGHQSRGRTVPPDDYWDLRLRKMHTRAPLCACGCGQKVLVTMKWLQEQPKRNCRIPLYVEGHMPTILCNCGCGTALPAFSKRNRPNKGVSTHSWRMGLQTPETRQQVQANVLLRAVAHQEYTQSWNANPPLCACGCGQPLHKTARQLKYSSAGRQRYLVGHVHRHGTLTELTELETSVILGSLLGDFSLQRAGPSYAPRLTFTHGCAQLEYAKHKADMLSRLDFTLSVYTPKGSYSQNQVVRGASKSIPALAKIWDLTRSSGKKTVTLQWLSLLDARSWAYWYMDDGSCGPLASSVRNPSKLGYPSSICLHTEGFSALENQLLAQYLGTKGISGVRAVSTKGDRYYYLYFPRDAARAFLDMIAPYVHPSMAYKMPQYFRGENGTSSY